MNAIIRVLSVIGAIAVLAFLVGAAVLIYMVWSIRKCDRNELRRWQQEREIRARDEWKKECDKWIPSATNDGDDTKPYPPEGIH
jgi:hypothetical protein